MDAQGAVCPAASCSSTFSACVMPHYLSPRFGIAEWFGRAVSGLSRAERAQFAEEARKTSPSLPCLPRAAESGGTQPCTKRGGVCSIRLYAPAEPDEAASNEAIEADRPQLATPTDTPVVTLCPYRFREGDAIYRWAGEAVLGTSAPAFVEEIPFLERDRHPAYYDVWGTSEEEDEDARSNEDAGDEAAVGRIDGILVDAEVSPQESGYALDVAVTIRDWCALEIQSVYFSGKKMGVEYRPFTQVAPPGVPFPVGRRRADFRSSSAKRLLPQLQTKIPSLRRWGKKMVVVVDEAFFYEMAEMDTVDDISNGDIAWLVVGYDDDADGELRLRRRALHVTTLEDAVTGLTAGRPVPRTTFEAGIASRLRVPHLEAHVEQLSARLQALMQRREALRAEGADDEEERLKEECKRIRAVRARLNRQIR